VIDPLGEDKGIVAKHAGRHDLQDEINDLACPRGGEEECEADISEGMT
jgi:hypothetical protein